MKSQQQALNRKPFDNFAHRLSFIREKRDVSLGALANGKPSTAKSWESGTTPRHDLWEGLAAKLGVTVSFLFLGQPKSDEDYDFVAKYADEIATPPSSGYRKPGSLPAAVHEAPSSYSGGVASRIPEQRTPSTRADCESYARRLFDAAELSDDPNAFPVLLHRLKKQFPLDEWENTGTEKKG